MQLFEARNAVHNKSWYNMSDTGIAQKAGEVLVPLVKVKKVPTLKRFGGTAREPCIPYLDIRFTKRGDRPCNIHSIDLGEEYEDRSLVWWRVTAGEGGDVVFDTKSALKVITLQEVRHHKGVHAYVIALLGPRGQISVKRNGIGIEKTALTLRYEDKRITITGKKVEDAFPEPDVQPTVISLTAGKNPLYTGYNTAGLLRPEVLRANALRLAQELDPNAVVLFTGSTHPRVAIVVHEVFRPFCRTIYCSGPRGPELMFEKSPPKR